MQFTLLIPELLWPEPQDRDTLDSLACPALETLLARGARSRQAPQSYEATLCDAAGLPPDAPYAALRRLGEADAVRGTETAGRLWLNADPVHLRFLQERLVLADPGQLDIRDDEAHALLAELNLHLGSSGRFHFGAAGRWYLEVLDPALCAEISPPPLSAVAGRSIERLLPPAGEARRLRRLFNEVQMLLHSHPVNAQREESGRMVINSLWLWGGGALPTAPDHGDSQADDENARSGLPETGFDSIWSHDPLARGLARAAGVPARAQPETAAALLAHAAPDGHALVVLDDLLAAVQYESGEAYRDTLSRLENDWFAPLLAALQRGTGGTNVHALTLVAPTAYGALTWQLRRRDSWFFWRQRQALAALANELAQAD